MPNNTQTVPNLYFGPFEVDVAGVGGDQTVVFCNRCRRNAEWWDIEWRPSYKVVHSETGHSFVAEDRQIATLKVRCHHDDVEVTL
jgi:hypothetical protein